MKQTYHSVKSKFNKVAILDRDGVINIDFGYVSNIDQIIFVEGLFEGLKYLQDKKYDLFVATNQSGVARGFYGENDVNELHRLLSEKFKSEGIFIGGFLYCPHHLDASIGAYKKNCYWRKPMPGMIEAILKLNNYDKKKSFLIGDNNTDIIAAEKAGIKGFKFLRGNIFELIKHIT
jgi:D-glycero-D-manno-heptose 1,7-bisphosphate phosphatase